MTKTHNEHLRRVQLRHGSALAVVSIYKHSLRRVTYECPIHGRFKALASNIEVGHGCALCAHDRHRTKHDDHVSAVRQIHGDRLRVVGTYRGANIKLVYTCFKHGEFETKPANVIHRRSGCRRCYEETIGPRSRKTHETYIAEARSLGACVLDHYITALVPLRHRCSKGHIWSTSPNQLLSGNGCPLCDTSQYRRRPIKVGSRTVLVQGAEGKAVAFLLAKGAKPNDLAFTASEGKPTFRYRFRNRTRRYIPDIFILSTAQVVEVKSFVTLGFYDQAIFAQVRAKGRAVVAAGYGLRLMVIHRGQNIDLPDWYRLSWKTMTRKLRRLARAQDRRSRRT